MDHIRHIIVTNAIGSDSGIDGCTSVSCGSSSQQLNQPNTSNSEATSATIDLSDVHLQDDIPLTDDDGGYLVSDDDEADVTNNDDKNRRTQRLSTDSGSTFEIVDGPDPLDDGWCSQTNQSPVEPQVATSSKSLSTTSKISEKSTSIEEERDTYSPINPSDGEIDDRILNNLQLVDVNAGGNGGDEENNKLFRRNHLCDRSRLSSKEEKQRQNEEIVIMESSSVSSETGSWESVFPQRTPTADATETCNVFIKNERQQSMPPSGVSPIAPATKELPEFCYSSKATTSIGACFIDASSLMDDTEMYSSLNVGPQLPEVGCCGPRPTNLPVKLPDKCDTQPIETSSDIEKLETFHKDFEKCKIVNLKPEASPTDVTADLNSPNLSDEQKLLHRGSSEHRIEYDIKDQFSVDLAAEQKQYSAPSSGVFESGVDASSQDEGIVVTTGNTSSSEKSDTDSRFRQEQERKQGNFLFKNSIQHYSGNVLNSKIPYIDRGDENYSDMSLPSMYSTCSEPFNNNDFVHAYETGSQYSCSNFGDGAISDAESGFYPDTPHNSIVHIDTPPRCYSRTDSGSGGGANLSSPEIIGVCGVKIPKRVFKCDESAPIVSGGASIKDFTPKLCENPSIRRKTETCPILSGGMTPKDFQDDEPKTKPKEKPKITAQSTWVVDMSDCHSRSSRGRSDSSSSSTDNASTSRSIEHSGSGSSHKSGLGFYVSLNDIKSPAVKSVEIMGSPTAKKLPASESMKKSTGFYVDISDSERSRSGTPVSLPSAQDKETIKSESADKKNIFSMFIDFGEKKVVPKKDPSSFTSRLTSSLQKQKEMATSSDNESVGSSDTNDRDGKTVPSAVLRRSHSPSTSSRSDSKRHSWNVPKEKTTERTTSREYARSASLSTADNGIMSILDKIPIISKTSSMSIDSPNSPYDDFTCSKSISSYSNNSNSLTSNSVHSSIESRIKTEMPDIMATSVKKRRQDAKINETFDKSSQGSLTDGVLSKDSSPTTDTDDVTFQNEDVEGMAGAVVAGRNPTMETIIETKETASPKKVQLQVQQQSQQNISAAAVVVPVINASGTGKVAEVPHTMETLQATIEKQKLLLETVNEEVQLSSFVKLSDMDKPVQKFELHGNDTLSKSVGSTTRIGRLFVDTKTSSGRNSWSNTMSRSTGNNLTNLASSVENLKSLSRLFPHLSKELSSSLPADIQIDDLHNNKSPINGELPEYIPTDLSCTSSLTSSFSRSGIDSADESSLSCRQPRRLGEDLLKMFLQEIATDVILEVGGRRMRAHKCILRSRCQYFAAILAGGWVQQAGNVITLPGYSFGSVHFALCHIYSGAAHPPEGISLMELAALADLLGLEGLKEVTAHALRTNYCHNFHKPCSGCIEGILQVFPVTLNHGLDDLYRKCLRWACKHYVKVWPTRAFAQLPADIVSRCKQHVVAHLTSETVLNAILDCDHLLTLLAPCRWAIGIENTVRDIIDTAHNYISDHFASLIASDGFLSLGHGQSWNISRLENLLLRIASTLTPDQACRSYQRVTRLNAVLGARVLKISSTGLHIDEDSHLHHLGHHHHAPEQEEEMDWNPEFLRLVSSILSAVEQCLTRQCARAMRNNQWQRMDLDLRKKIQKLACLSDPVENRRSRSQQSNKSLTYNSVTPTSNNRNQDLYQVKLAIQAHSKRAQENSQQYRASAHTQTNYNDRMSVHATTDKCVQANDQRDRGMGKVLKTSSRAHVPDLIPTTITKPKQTDRPTSLGHRRSHSETINTRVYKHSMSVDATIDTKTQVQHTSRLTEIKPRYLEPKRNGHSGIRILKTPSNLSVKGKNISSSDSSTRNSSPALNKRPMGKPKKIIESATMSRDSLSSPAKHPPPKTVKNKIVNDFEISVDSLGDSLRSSVKTDKTLSQESLVKYNATKKLMNKPTTLGTITSLKSQFSRSNPVINKESAGSTIITSNNRLMPSAPAHQRNKSLSCQTTTENSPSSVTTTKSSRLSSITSAVSSPREAFNTRRSLSTPQSVSAPKKSFLSAKSREILAAKKQSALNHAESTKSVPGFIREKIQAIPVNKSSSTSNMMNNRRPITFPTTLHLRRTAKVPAAAPTETTKNVSIKGNNQVVNSKKKSKVDRKSGSTTTVMSHNKIKVEIERDEKPIVMRIESKLERSSTFCKESSDIPTSDLQIIE